MLYVPLSLFSELILRGSKVMKQTRLQPTDIAWDNNVVTRKTSDEKYLTDLVFQMHSPKESLPPITVVFDGIKYWGVDGRYLCTAAQMRGDKTILANVIEGTRAQAIWYAATANFRNGLRPKRADMERAAMNILRAPEFAEIASTKIGRHCGLTADAVDSLKRDLENASLEQQDNAEDERIQKAKAKMSILLKSGKPRRAGRRQKAARQKALDRQLQNDGSGHPVPDWCRPVVVEDQLIDHFLTLMSNVFATAEKLSHMPSGAGKQIDVKALLRSLQDIRDKVRDGRFWATCPECRGRGQPSEMCSCGGSGWMTRRQYEDLSSTPVIRPHI